MERVTNRITIHQDPGNMKWFICIDGMFVSSWYDSELAAEQYIICCIEESEKNV